MPLTKLSGLQIETPVDISAANLTGITTATDLNATRINVTGVGTISTGSITTLNANTGNIVTGLVTNFTSTNGSITNLTGTSSTITTFRSTTLNSDTGNIVTGVTTNFTSTNGSITNLTGTAGTVTTLRSTTGNFTTGNIVTGVTTNFNATNVVISGVTSVSSGTAAVPSISRPGDTNTGIFFPDPNMIAVTTSGVEKLRINASGNVGIGTTNPSDDGPLTLSNSTATPTLFFERMDNSYNGAIQCGGFGTLTFYNGADSSVVSGLTPRMIIDGQYGSVTTSYQPRANISKTVGQTLVTTAIKITFTDETYDVGGNFSSSRYTAPVSGYYLVSTSVNVVATASNVTMSVYKNGAVYGGMDFFSAGANIRFNYSMTGVVFLSVSDYIEIFGLVSTGTVVVDNAGFLSVALLG